MTRIHPCVAAVALLLGAALAMAAPPASAPAEITFTGKISTGMMAIGGETTGTVISDGKTTYELDIRDNVMKRKAQELSGKNVTVKGTLTVKEGIEVGQRRIIVVTALNAAAASAPAA